MLLRHTLINGPSEPQSELIIAENNEHITRLMREFIDYVIGEESETLNEISKWLLECAENLEMNQIHQFAYGNYHITITEDDLKIRDVIAGYVWQAQIIDTDTTSETIFYLD